MEIKKMKLLRFHRQLTLDDIHLLCGRKITQSKLSRIERGISLPSDEEKKLIAKALRVSITECFPKSEEVKE